MIVHLRLAVSFLTIIPAYPHQVDTARLGKAVPWFPVVGALIGALVGVVVWLVSAMLPVPVAAMAGVATGMLLTRGFHEDGLADSADGLGGGWTPEERIEIMKDSRVGTYGALALIVSVLWRTLLVASIARPDVIPALIASHAIARSGAVAMMTFVGPARTEGLGADYLRGASKTALVLGSLAGCGVGLLCLGPVGLAAIATVAVSVGVVGVLSVRKIGGVTGDTAGAAEQVGEMAVLVWAV